MSQIIRARYTNVGVTVNSSSISIDPLTQPKLAMKFPGLVNVMKRDAIVANLDSQVTVRKRLRVKTRPT